MPERDRTPALSVDVRAEREASARRQREADEAMRREYESTVRRYSGEEAERVHVRDRLRVGEGVQSGALEGAEVQDEEDDACTGERIAWQTKHSQQTAFSRLLESVAAGRVARLTARERGRRQIDVTMGARAADERYPHGAYEIQIVVDGVEDETLALYVSAHLACLLATQEHLRDEDRLHSRRAGAALLAVAGYCPDTAKEGDEVARTMNGRVQVVSGLCWCSGIEDHSAACDEARAVVGAYLRAERELAAELQDAFAPAA